MKNRFINPGNSFLVMKLFAASGIEEKWRVRICKNRK